MLDTRGDLGNLIQPYACWTTSRLAVPIDETLKT